MAPQSDDSIGPLEIGKLLELLNASELREDTADQADQDPQDQVPTPAAPPAEPNPVEQAVDQFDAIDNRFAAHIVKGMWKLKRG